MSDIFQLLTSQEAFIETGLVKEHLGNGQYRVNIAGRDKLIRSAEDKSIDVGSRVVINRHGNYRYIVGITHKLNSNIEKEIIIDG